MSVQAISWVIENSQQRLGSFIVLLMIANHAKSDGTDAWPSMATLAKESRLSETQTHRCIRKLLKSGELSLEISAGPKGTNLYSLPRVAEYKNGTPIKLAPPPIHDSGVPFRSKNPPEMAPEPSLTVLIEPSKEQKNISVSKKFQVPTENEVVCYMTDQGFRTPADTAAKFINYYEMLGWIPKGSKTQMKSWKAAVRTWKSRERTSGQTEDPEHERIMLEIEREAKQHDAR